MGAPLPPNAIMPPRWAEKAELRLVTIEEGLEDEPAYWIGDLGAWVAEDEAQYRLLRAVMPDATILLPSELPRERE